MKGKVLAVIEAANELRPETQSPLKQVGERERLRRADW